ncbi:hypothetical protein GGE16_001502 [Rhizobium leguminosarum]|uniref:Transmembrane protein n=1 Tax=Rhizobium leguminosarum TaxID=384 RepID=A0AAE2MHM6_RHILE|nr:MULTISPECIES: hypothetical protein [Rhizobium]MBB4289486.1 hypothetical protein [Rhizobium leguminosarum]MBB4294418.1 hypothetical protein [Rhizobium leguminosarum]MBB4305814.1 hypothetical protein [Rhizobium leguminosarum]MBB4418609.1 hypothetical protein [Rhizobium leguminosarum]MBB4433453.1 hypothetical protein [Rhizobium esperanzae]
MSEDAIPKKEPTGKDVSEPKTVPGTVANKNEPSDAGPEVTLAETPSTPKMSERPTIPSNVGAVPETNGAKRYPPLSPELQRAAEDVRILYSYISREGRLEPEKLLEQPLSIYAETPDRILDPANPPSYEERATLWKILSELSNLARPASADTIRSSYYSELMNAASGSGRKSNRVVERPIRTLGVIGFIVTLLLGLYVSFTESVVADTIARINEYNNIRVGTYAGTRLEKLAITPVPGRAANTSTITAPGETDQQPKNDDLPLPMAQSGANVDFDFSTLRTEALDEIDREINNSFEILRFATLQFGDQSKQDVSTPQGKHSLFERTLLNIQGYVNKTISAFILPAIASLLGAVVFILRDAQRRMESVSLSPLRSETYGPRIILAVIAGTVIGWLSGQDASGVFGKISPAAASFVVGYCTEILFRLLDSIKQALGVDEEEAAARQKTVPRG